VAVSSGKLELDAEGKIAPVFASTCEKKTALPLREVARSSVMVVPSSSQRHHKRRFGGSVHVKKLAKWGCVRTTHAGTVTKKCNLNAKLSNHRAEKPVNTLQKSSEGSSRKTPDDRKRLDGGRLKKARSCTGGLKEGEDARWGGGSESNQPGMAKTGGSELMMG